MAKMYLIIARLCVPTMCKGQNGSTSIGITMKPVYSLSASVSMHMTRSKSLTLNGVRNVQELQLKRHCRNIQNGCKERFPQQINNRALEFHEDECMYRIVKCPSGKWDKNVAN